MTPCIYNITISLLLILYIYIYEIKAASSRQYIDFSNCISTCCIFSNTRILYYVMFASRMRHSFRSNFRIVSRAFRLISLLAKRNCIYIIHTCANLCIELVILEQKLLIFEKCLDISYIFFHLFIYSIDTKECFSIFRNSCCSRFIRTLREHPDASLHRLRMLEN